jgi:hypothetical protein
MPRTLRARPLLALSCVIYFTFALLAPMLSAFQAESRIPQCCRRNGAHHCMMNGVLNIGNAVGISSLDHCPMWPHALAPANTQPFAVSDLQSHTADLLPVSTLRVHNAELGRIARERQLSLRGPPPSVA